MKPEPSCAVWIREALALQLSLCQSVPRVSGFPGKQSHVSITLIAVMCPGLRAWPGRDRGRAL